MTATSFPGLYVGHVEVIENDDDEYPGSIKVSIPSIFGRSEGDEAAVWARPCFTYGHFFVPEVGDKVWLAFENGNSQSPVWLGVWYPAGKTPTNADSASPKKRVIQTATNNSIIFNDADGEESIEIQDQNGNKVLLDGDGITILNGSDTKIEMTSSGIKIDAGAKIEITSSGIKIDAGASSIEATSNSSIMLKSSDIQLGNSPLGRVTTAIDQWVGNLGAPVTLVTPGSLSTKA
ncbi:hypothetical protein C8255_06090 [filamentous cyanobacterium CCP3]|nr:hypothetical protein C8255_06090 [filamentous cyanobacterium CCP3]